MPLFKMIQLGVWVAGSEDGVWAGRRQQKLFALHPEQGLHTSWCSQAADAILWGTSGQSPDVAGAGGNISKQSIGKCGHGKRQGVVWGYSPSSGCPCEAETRF